MRKVILGAILFVLGALGVLSLLTSEIPIPEAQMQLLLERLEPDQIKWILLINPLIMLLIAVVIGTLLHEKVGLKVPIIFGIISGKAAMNWSGFLISGVAGGLLSGVLIVLSSIMFHPILPEAYLQMGDEVQLSIASRFLYGGITEELLMRYGLMTLVIWIIWLITKSLNSGIYWIGIVVAALLFAVGHFPAVYAMVESPSTALLVFILLGNSIGGVIFGWLYWKMGLESAFIAHILTHVVLLLSEPLLQSVTAS